MSKTSGQESLNNICVANVSDQDFISPVIDNYRIFRPITRALSIQKGSEIVKNEHARYTLERLPTDNARVICTKEGIEKYGIMY